MKTIIVMSAILILAVSMIACGASQNSQTQTQTTQTVLGDWTGIITGTPAPFPSSMALDFGAEQGAYNLPVGGWFDTGLYFNDSCAPGAQAATTVINGANFTMTNTNPDDTLFQMTGSVTGAGTGNTATGTITFPNLCNENAWTGNFTATGGQYNGNPPPSSGATIIGGWTGNITGLGNVPGSFAGTSEFQFNATESPLIGNIAFSITGCGPVGAGTLSIEQNGLNFSSTGTENASDDTPGNVTLNGAVSSNGQSISGTVYFTEPCSPNLAWEANFSATRQ